MPRPFKIGLGYTAMCIVLTFPLAFIVVIISFSTWQALLLSASLALLGGPVFTLLEMAKERKWCEFEEVSLLNFGDKDSAISGDEEVDDEEEEEEEEEKEEVDRREEESMIKVETKIMQTGNYHRI